MFDLFGIVKIGLKFLFGVSSGNLLETTVSDETSNTTTSDGGSWYSVGFDIEKFEAIYKTSRQYGGVLEIMKFLDHFLIPITIGLLALAVVLVIAIGVKMAKADTPSAAEEAKKRLWGVAIGFASFMAAVWLGALIMNNIPDIIEGLQKVFNFTGQGWQTNGT